MKTTSILNILALFSTAVALSSAAQQQPRTALRGAARNLQFACESLCISPGVTLAFLERCVQQCDDEGTPAPTPSPTPIPTFRIINPQSSLALDIRGNNNCDGDGSRMEIRTVDDNRPTQRFYFGPDNSILSVGCDGNNDYAITRAADCSAGSGIHLSPYTGGRHQQWEIQDNESILSTGRGCNLVLDVFGKQTFDGADIILYHPNGQGNQEWVLVA
jgi:hypothetical protein